MVGLWRLHLVVMADKANHLGQLYVLGQKW